MAEGAQQAANDKTAVRPFHVNVPEAELTDLRSRVNAAKWPERETVTDDSQGVPLAMMQELARYWAADYDWRKCEAKLNALPAPPVTSAVLGYTSHGHPAGDLTRDDVLDNITLYWLTSTAVSSARLYWENKLSLYNDADVSVPAAVSVFPGENYQAPRSWAERAYHNLIYFNEVDKGGHFAAWEQPQLFSAEVRAGFRPLRK